MQRKRSVSLDGLRQRGLGSEAGRLGSNCRTVARDASRTRNRSFQLPPEHRALLAAGGRHLNSSHARGPDYALYRT
jgi:hypothetical protein